MKIYALGDAATFVIERDGKYTHDDWPCKTAMVEAMIADGMLKPISYDEAQQRIDALEESGRPLAYWPLPEREQA